MTLSRSDKGLSAPRSCWLLLGALVLAAPAAAHDHWIAPAAFRCELNERVDLHLCVGHPSQFEEQIRDSRHFVRFDAFSLAGTKPVPGVDGRSPAGIFRSKEEGLHLLVFQSDHAFVEIEPEKYARYLHDEGLADVEAERERRSETALPGRDSYLRCDKALVRVGAGASASAGFDRVIGLPCELVLETDPMAWNAGGAVVVLLNVEGTPMPDRQVKLMALAAPFTITLARTDEHGRARFTSDRAGPWVASAVHQRRAKPEQKLEGDWEGLWASLSFELGSAEPRPAH